MATTLKDAAETLIYYIEAAYNRQGTGPKLEPAMLLELADVVEAFAYADVLLDRNQYPPGVSDREVENALGYENFDRVVCLRTGIYGRQPSGNWVKLKTLALIDAENAAAAAQRADEAARTAAQAQAAMEALHKARGG